LERYRELLCEYCFLPSSFPQPFNGERRSVQEVRTAGQVRHLSLPQESLGLEPQKNVNRNTVKEGFQNETPIIKNELHRTEEMSR
jgi:hypothetical protein